MSAPLYDAAYFGAGTSLLFALLLGAGFGWFLERAGLGSARKLAGQFYLTDLAVFKVMFSAILTAMLGAFWLSRLGVLDLSLVYVPGTWVLPQMAGGLVFGVGFVTAGLCPGTGCVAASSGRVDGLALIAGMLAGTLLFGEVFPLLDGFYRSTPLGNATLASLTGLPTGVVVCGVTALGLAGFAAAERVERVERRSGGAGPEA